MLDTLFNLTNQIVIQNISNMVGVFSSTIAPLLGACVILYAIYLAYQSLYQPENLIIMESMKFICSLAIVTFISFNSVWYLDNIVPAVLGTGDQIAQVLLGNPTGGGVSSLQLMHDETYAGIKNIMSGIKLDIMDSDTWIDTIFRGGLVVLSALGSTLFVLIAAGNLLMAKIVISLLLILGPLFVMMSFFPSTRSFFQSWSGQLFNYTLLAIMYPLAFTVFSQLLDSTVFSANLTLSTHLMSIVIYGILIMISNKIPTLCSTLSGGIGISGIASPQGMVGAALRSAGLIANGTKKSWGNGSKTLDNYRSKGKGTISPG